MLTVNIVNYISQPVFALNTSLNFVLAIGLRDRPVESRVLAADGRHGVGRVGGGDGVLPVRAVLQVVSERVGHGVQQLLLHGASALRLRGRQRHHLRAEGRAKQSDSRSTSKRNPGLIGRKDGRKCFI